MKVPASFDLYGTRIRVVFRSQDEFDTNCQYGFWCAADSEISIRKGMSRDASMATFCHEWVHAALEASSRSDLSSDERLVESLGGLLHQLTKTAR